jgi:hypothetical protein
MKNYIIRLKNSTRGFFLKNRSLIALYYLPRIAFASIEWYILTRKIKLDKDEWGFVFNEHLGDLYINCSLSNSFIKAHPNTKFVAITYDTPSFGFIPTMFPSISRVIKVKRLPKLINSKLISQFFKFGVGCVLPSNIKLTDFGVTNFYAEKKRFFSLPIDTPLSPPLRPSKKSYSKARKLFSSFCLKEGKTVILAPHAKSGKEFTPRFWENMATFLKELGFLPVQEIVPGESLISNVKQISFPIDVAIPMVELAGTLISLRSGLCDAVSSAKANLLVLYPYYKQTTDAQSPITWQKFHSMKEYASYNKYIKEFLMDINANMSSIKRTIGSVLIAK